MTRCREAGALTNHFTQLLVGLQLWLEETLRKWNNRSKDAAPAAAVPQVSLEAHVHLQQFINSLPLSVPLLSTYRHTLNDHMSKRLQWSSTQHAWGSFMKCNLSVNKENIRTICNLQFNYKLICTGWTEIQKLHHSFHPPLPLPWFSDAAQDCPSPAHVGRSNAPERPPAALLEAFWFPAVLRTVAAAPAGGTKQRRLKQHDDVLTVFVSCILSSLGGFLKQLPLICHIYQCFAPIQFSTVT